MTSPSARLSRSPRGVRHLRVLRSTTFGPSCDSLGAIACDTDGPRVAASLASPRAARFWPGDQTIWTCSLPVRLIVRDRSVASVLRQEPCERDRERSRSGSDHVRGLFGGVAGLRRLAQHADAGEADGLEL